MLTALAVVAATVGASLAACDSRPGRDDEAGSGAELDQALVGEALEFGRIVLPPSAVVLGVETERGTDLLYAVAVRMDPGDVDRMLVEWGFTAELEPGRQVFMPTVAGVEVGSVDRIASAQDRVRSGHGAGTVTREILVDRSNPDGAIVHLWLFTT